MFLLLIKVSKWRKQNKKGNQQKKKKKKGKKERKRDKARPPFDKKLGRAVETLSVSDGEPREAAAGRADGKTVHLYNVYSPWVKPPHS